MRGRSFKTNPYTPRAVVVIMLLLSTSLFIPDVSDNSEEGGEPLVDYGTRAGGNWLSGWDYRKQHDITGSTGAGTGYQMEVKTIYDGNLLTYINETGGYEGTNPVIAVGGAGAWNEKIRELGNVLYEPTDGGKEYKTWFTAYNDTYDGYTNLSVGYAYGSDGISWTQVDTGYDYAEDVYVIKVASTYYMYFENKSAGDVHESIARATSPDGETWTYDQVVLEEQGSDWEGKDVSSPIVWKEGTTWYMLYEGRHFGTSAGTVGKCTSTDGITWTGRTQVFTPGAGGKWDDEQVVDDDLMIDGSDYYMTYHGYDGTSWRAGMAKTTDFSTWTRLNGADAITPNSNGMMLYETSEYIFHYATSDTSGIYRGYPDKRSSVSLEGHSLTDFGDVRFTDNDGSTEIDYWLDNKTDSIYAFFWVEVADDLASDQTIYIYYGKTGEVTTSNGTNTFPVLFDDFENGTVGNPPSGWTGDTGNFEVQNDQAQDGSQSLRAYPPAATWKLLSKSYSDSGLFIQEFSIREDTKTATFVLANRLGATAVTWVGFSTGGNLYYYDVAGVYIMAANADQWYDIKLIINTTSDKYAIYIDDVLKVPVADFRANVASLDTVRLEAYDNTYRWIDRLFIREYVDSEPTHAAWGSEETPTAYSSRISVSTGVVDTPGAGVLTGIGMIFRYLQLSDTQVAFTSTILGYSEGREMNITYFWDFGDGETSTLKNPVHEYDYDGWNANYNTTLTVCNRNGCAELYQNTHVIRWTYVYVTVATILLSGIIAVLYITKRRRKG